MISSFFSTFPIIELGNVILRELSLNDKEQYLNVLSNPLVQQYLADEDIPRDINKAGEDIKFWSSLFHKKRSIYWAIEDTSTKKFIGSIGFCSINFYNSRADISYELSADYWRKGIMSKCLSNVLLLIFRKLLINRIEGYTMTTNIGSQKLLETVGFKKEGVLREYRTNNGKKVDVCLYSLLKNEYIF